MIIVTIIIRLLLSVIFFRAALHKLRDWKTFQSELSAYQLLPDLLLQPSTVLLIALELSISMALLALQSNTGPLLAASLLIIYAMAMMTNLLKGRTYIDCGCSGPASSKKNISWSLVIRNFILAVLAFTCASLSTAAGITGIGALTLFIIVAGTVTSFLLYESIEHAIANIQNYRRWQIKQAGAKH